MTEEAYDQKKVEAGSHPVDEGCTAKEQCERGIGITIPVKSLWKLLTGKWKWGWR